MSTISFKLSSNITKLYKIEFPVEFKLFVDSLLLGKMKGFTGVSRSNVSKFTKVVAAVQLTKHKNRNVIPARQTPIVSSVLVFDYNSFEKSLWYKVYYLTENVLPLIHVCLILWLMEKLAISKGRQGFV